MTDADLDLQAEVYANFQWQLYQQGLEGGAPTLPISAVDLQERARQALSEEAYGYVAGGAGSEQTWPPRCLTQHCRRR